jgi:hypothetical protein
LEKATVTFGGPFDPRSPRGDTASREQIVEALRGRVLELGRRR